MNKFGFFLVLVICNNLFAQEVSNINPLLDPSKSSGYTIWENLGDAETFKIEIFEGSSGVSELVSTNYTNKNYFRFDPLIFNIPGISYQISGYDNSGILVSLSDIYNSLPQGPVTSYTNFCSKICNGITYAWSLYAYAEDFGDYNGNTRLKFTGACTYFDPMTGDYIPYWQAISSSAWNQIPNTHPYKQVLSAGGISGLPIYKYKRLYVNQNLSQGPFFDAYNNPVNDGILLEKKLDQFDYINQATTSEFADAGEGICIAPLSGPGLSWVNFFNQTDKTIYNSTPTSVLPFLNYVPTDIECISAYKTVKPGRNGANWNKWVLDLYKAIKKAEKSLNIKASEGDLDWELINNELNEIGGLISDDNDSINAISFESIIDEKSKIVFIRKDGKFVLISSEGKFDKGLYSINLFSNDAEVIPSYIEFSKDLPVIKIKDLVKLTINSNPIKDFKLDYSLDSDKTLNFKTLVCNLNGDVLYNKNYSFDHSFTENIDLTNLFIPMQQVILSIIFEDGSVLQEHVLID